MSRQKLTQHGLAPKAKVSVCENPKFCYVPEKVQGPETYKLACKPKDLCFNSFQSKNGFLNA